VAALPIFHLNVPPDDLSPALKWDGEWPITLAVFRDLGLAFVAVLVVIAMLLVVWFRSYVTPLVVRAAIPFSLIGILSAHWALGAFFTATSMIGFMAGAGIVVRSSSILVDFIELRRADGLPQRAAVIEAGAVRFRPMRLRALAVVVGASVILADPIFQGLAISLMFGEIASLFISRLAVPPLYFMANRRAAARGLCVGSFALLGNWIFGERFIRQRAPPRLRGPGEPLRPEHRIHRLKETPHRVIPR